MIGQSVTAMKSVQNVLGRVNDQRQAMIVAQPVDQVHVRQAVVHQVIVHVPTGLIQIVHVVMMIGRVPTGLIQIVRAAMMIVQNVLVTKNQNVVNGQANDLKQVMIADQQADRVLVDLQLADQVQIVRIPIAHVATIAQVVSVGIVRVSHAMIVVVMTVLVMIAHVVVVQIALAVGLLVMKMNVQHVTSPKSELTLMTRLFPITLPVKNYRVQCEMNFVHCQMA
jgi:hypothetical protein